jgi:DNA-binding helix-hairpin-helix protein with protein kinase domain
MRTEGRLLILITIVLIVALVAGEVLFFTGDGPRWRASLTVAGLALALVLVTATVLFLRYRSLPQVKEKRALKSEQAHVQRELETVQAELKSIEGTRWAIEQQERADIDRRRVAYEEQAAQFVWRRHMIGIEEKEEVKVQLGRLQAEHVARGLGSSQVFYAEISGVGRTLKADLAAAGIETAADVSYERVVAVRGFGRAKANAVVAWREDLERELVLGSPDRLPPEFEAEVRREFKRRRAALAAEEQAAAADLEDDLQAIERDASEFYVRNDLRQDRAMERLEVLKRQNAELASQLAAYSGVHPSGYLNALLAPDPSRPGSFHRLLRVAVPLIFVASLFCQGSAALRALATMA